MQAARTKVERANLMREWDIHVAFIKRERRGYWGRCNEAIVEPANVLSMIIDGEDQSATGMPAYAEIVHCTEKGLRIKLHLYGRKTNCLTLLNFNSLPLFVLQV